MEWNRIDLSEQYPYYANTDFWIVNHIPYPAGTYPQGMDSGPSVQGRNWYWSSQGWQEIYTTGLDYNLNIRAIVHWPFVGSEEQYTFDPRQKYNHYPSIIVGQLPHPREYKSYRIFDITGRQIHTLNPAPGIYFIEVDGEIRQKVIKIK